MDFRIDKAFILKTLQDLVRINSVNPELVPGGAGEAEIADYIAGTLRQCDLEPVVYKLKPGRYNVVAILKGKGRGRSLMLNGHMDTVGVEGMVDPFSAEIRSGRLYGRGAQDMKGSLAAMIAVFKTLRDSNIQLGGDLVFAAVADEEYGSIGTEALIKHHRADAAIVAEPTDLNICLTHKGFAVFEFETEGRAAHGGRYKEGIDANLRMGRILTELEHLSQDLLKRKTHPLLGPPSLHVPLIRGGSELFIYSDKCKISVERRTLPGESHETLFRDMKEIIARLTKEDKSLQARVRPAMYRHAYEISPDAEIVKIVTETASQVLGKSPEYIGHHWWEDSAILAESGIETAIIGPRGAGLHTHEEWVDINSVTDLATILIQTVIQYCN